MTTWEYFLKFFFYKRLRNNSKKCCSYVVKSILSPNVSHPKKTNSIIF